MSSDPFAIRVSNVSKHYMMFERPEDRLKQMIQPRFARLFGQPRKQYYRDFAALSGVSFDIRRAETVGIIGRNGCGKSTLLQIVCGTLLPTSGTVAVNGRIAALLELGAGFNPEFTGRENVFLNAAILGLSRAETEARFDAIARFADIGMFIDQPVKTYSSGMYVRLAFAVAINVDPDILVVDEALAVGDEAFQRKCFTRIEDIKDKGGTILFVSHGAQTIVQLCDRAILLDRGEKILEGRPKTVVNQYQRLVNLSGSDSEAVRNEIVAMDSAHGAERAMEHALPDDGFPAEESPIVAVPSVSPELYATDFQSASRVEYESRGARIGDPRLLNLEGEPVNVIVSGGRYIFEYTVEFDTECHDVAFGMGILTISGVSLGGANTVFNRNRRIGVVTAGRSFQARFEFDCILLAGTYVINCGVSGVVDGNVHYLHRIIDAVIFRVVQNDVDTAGGIIDFGIRLQLVSGGNPA